MRRIVGRGRKKAPAKTLDDTSKQFDERVANIDGKEAALNKKIRQLKFKINTLPKGSPARKQKERRDMESMAATVGMVRTMKTTKKQMKKQMKRIDIDKVADLKDDLDDIMMDNDEIQEMLGENAMMDGYDEDELDAELDALDEFEDEMVDVGETPDYMAEDAFPTAPDAEAGLDPYGLPPVSPDPVAEAEPEGDQI